MTKNSNRPTPAQTSARDRNWLIFRLRGLRQQMTILSGKRQLAAQLIIDEELLSMGVTLKEEEEEL